MQSHIEMFVDQGAPMDAINKQFLVTVIQLGEAMRKRIIRTLISVPEKESLQWCVCACC